jgi:dihydrolipoamide dehydrogenase
MADFDVIVVGGGTGNNVAAAAADAGLETALVEPGPLGGTCLNRGCNPSKMLIQAADAVECVRNAGKFHVDASLDGADVGAMVEEMSATLSDVAEGMEERYREKEHLTLFGERTRFVDERTLELGGEAVAGEKVVVAAGSRPVVPPIDGLDDAAYLTSDEALYLDEAPESLVILGGGYIAVELGYFFEAMGTDVTVVEKHDTLVSREDGDVAAAFTDAASERFDVRTGYRVTAVEEGGDGHVVRAEAADDGGAGGGDDALAVRGEEVLVALGRRPNGDTLNLDAAGVETDDEGFVETNEYLETTAEGVWAQGDIVGAAPFKHAGDYETRHTVANVVRGERRALDLSAMPHAIFTEPQIAGVGATEEELESAGREYAVGRAEMPDSPMGRAKKLDVGFVKALVAPDGGILGCHVFGEEAATLLHEAVVAMRNDLSAADVVDTLHVHPTLNGVVASAFRDAADP